MYWREKLFWDYGQACKAGPNTEENFKDQARETMEEIEETIGDLEGIMEGKKTGKNYVKTILNKAKWELKKYKGDLGKITEGEEL